MVNGEDVGAEVMFGPGEIRYRPCNKMWYRCATDGLEQSTMRLEVSAQVGRQMHVTMRIRRGLSPAVPLFLCATVVRFYHASRSSFLLLQAHMADPYC